MLKLFNRLCTNSSIPRSLNGIKQLIHKAVSVYKFGELHIPYPTGWEVEKLAFPIDPIMVYLRDPMELIAELFVNPQIMFKYFVVIFIFVITTKATIQLLVQYMRI